MSFHLGLLCGYLSRDLWWVRLSGPGVLVKRTRALFSERYGYRRPFCRYRGWRAFWLRSRSDTGD